MPQYMFSVDTDLFLRDWDDNLERLRGLVLEGAAGKPYFNMFPHILSDGKDAVGEAVATGREFRCSGYRISCLFGYIEADVIITPTYTEEGITGAQVKLYADHPCSLSKRLEQLQPLVDIAKNSASLAHGVRNPLNAIKGAVTYLAQKYSGESVLLEFTEIIQEEIDKLDMFITRFLSNSFDSPEIVQVDLNDIIKKICVMTELQAAAKGIRLHVDLCEVPKVSAMAFQLEHALLNLVNNAFEAIDGGGDIHLATSRKEKPGGAVVQVTISDNGPGFVCDRASLSYPQGDRAAEGRGFGLFLSREILQSYGGRLEISSERGRGTSILVSLPAAR